MTLKCFKETVRCNMGQALVQSILWGFGQLVWLSDNSLSTPKVRRLWTVLSSHESRLCDIECLRDPFHASALPDSALK